jgi:hypothetical protein
MDCSAARPAKTPSQKFRMDFGYQESDRPGVWHSNNTMLDILYILVLNDLSDAPHNLFIKCFASRKKEKERSFRKLFEFSCKQLNASLAGLKPEDILGSLSDEDIMAYINKKEKGVKAKR